MTRDPARIDRVLNALREYWKSAPDLRLCQIVGNMLSVSVARLPDDGPVVDGAWHSFEDDKVEKYLVGLNTARREATLKRAQELRDRIVKLAGEVQAADRELKALGGNDTADTAVAKADTRATAARVQRHAAYPIDLQGPPARFDIGSIIEEQKKYVLRCPTCLDDPRGELIDCDGSAGYRTCEACHAPRDKYAGKSEHSQSRFQPR